MVMQETPEAKLKRLGILEKPILEVANELESLRAIRDELSVLIDSAREEGMESEMFLNSFDRLEVLLYPSRFDANPTKKT
jgi:hypothetical protein